MMLRKQFFISCNNLFPIQNSPDTPTGQHLKLFRIHDVTPQCTSVIEALVSDEYHDVPYWTITSVGHNGRDYYLVGHKNIPMKGLRVRVRTQPWPWQ